MVWFSVVSGTGGREAGNEEGGQQRYGVEGGWGNGESGLARSLLAARRLPSRTEAPQRQLAHCATPFLSPPPQGNTHDSLQEMGRRLAAEMAAGGGDGRVPGALQQGGTEAAAQDHARG